MNRRGEWITPYYNGSPWFEKPILLYWCAKPSMAVFGDWIGPRIPSVMATIGAYVLIAWFARRRWDDQTARWCVLVAASTVLIVGVGRMMMTDALLDLCLVGAFVFFWESLVGDRRWRLLGALFLGLAVLAKGPVAILLFIPVAAWTYWREVDLRPAFKRWWLLGTLIFFATVASWYVPAYLENGRMFVQKFLIEQNLNRFTGGDPAHTLPFFTGLLIYPLVLFVAMAPWSFYFVKAWPRNSDPEQCFLAAWALVPFIFFMVSKAKLPHYVLPCGVPLALLVGHFLAKKRSADPLASVRELRNPLAVCLAVAVLVNTAFLAYYYLPSGSGQAGLHQIASYTREHASPDEAVAVFQMSRHDADLGTGKLQIQETSHPSLVMYLDRVVETPESMNDLFAHAGGVWIITPAGRFDQSEVDAAHRLGREVREQARQGRYALYYLTPAPGFRTRRSAP